MIAGVIWTFCLICLVALSGMIIGWSILNHTIPKGFFEWLTLIVTVIVFWFYYVEL